MFWPLSMVITLYRCQYISLHKHPMSDKGITMTWMLQVIIHTCPVLYTMVLKEVFVQKKVRQRRWWANGDDSKATSAMEGNTRAHRHHPHLQRAFFSFSVFGAPLQWHNWMTMVCVKTLFIVQDCLSSTLELERQRNIERNRELLAQLELPAAVSALGSVAT